MSTHTPQLSQSTATSATKEPHGQSADREVLRCKSTAEFLAALPFVTGFTDENSLFVVLFHGTRAGEVLRFELPQDQTRATTEPLLHAIESVLGETGAGAAGPAIVLTTSQGFGTGSAAPWTRLARRVERRFRSRGWRVRELAIVASDGWCTLLGPSQSVRRSRDEIHDSPIAERARELHDRPGRLGGIGDLPDVNSARSEAIATHLAALKGRRQPEHTSLSGDTSRAHTQAWVHSTARVADTCFQGSDAGRRSDGALEPRLLARLIEAAQQPDRWLILALTAMMRAEVVVSATAEHEVDRLSGISVDLEAHTDDAGEWSIKRLLMSLSHEEPDINKLKRAIDAVADAAAHAPHDYLQGLLALLAWLWWLKGMQSVAQRIVQRSLSIDAGHELTNMVAEMNLKPPAFHLHRLRATYAASA